jgi:hypothetical protein
MAPDDGQTGVRTLAEIAEYPEARDRVVHYAGLLEYLLKSITTGQMGMNDLVKHHKHHFKRAKFQRVSEARLTRNILTHPTPYSANAVTAADLTPGEVLAAERTLYKAIILDILPLCPKQLQRLVSGDTTSPSASAHTATEAAPKHELVSSPPMDSDFQDAGPPNRESPLLAAANQIFPPSPDLSTPESTTPPRQSDGGPEKLKFSYLAELDRFNRGSPSPTHEIPDKLIHLCYELRAEADPRSEHDRQTIREIDDFIRKRLFKLAAKEQSPIAVKDLHPRAKVSTTDAAPEETHARSGTPKAGLKPAISGSMMNESNRGPYSRETVASDRCHQFAENLFFGDVDTDPDLYHRFEEWFTENGDIFTHISIYARSGFQGRVHIRVCRWLKNVGDNVHKGEPLCVLASMGLKLNGFEHVPDGVVLEQTLLSPVSGRLDCILVEAGRRLRGPECLAKIAIPE